MAAVKRKQLSKFLTSKLHIRNIVMTTNFEPKRITKIIQQYVNQRQALTSESLPSWRKCVSLVVGFVFLLLTGSRIMAARCAPRLSLSRLRCTEIFIFISLGNSGFHHFLVLTFSSIFLASWLVFWRVEPTMLVARLASNTQELRANPVFIFMSIKLWASKSWVHIFRAWRINLIA